MPHRLGLDYGFRNSSGNLAIFAAIRRASSRVSGLAADLQSLISESREYMFNAPWYGIFPGVAIAATVLSLSAVSDRVRARRHGG